MTLNMLEEYINSIVKKNISQYIKIIFEYKHDRKICEEYINAYLKIRYTNYSDIDKNMNQHTTIRKKILETLKNTEEKLLKEYPEEEVFIKNVHIFFYYVLYFDGVINSKNLEQKIDRICKIRIKILNKNSDKFKEKLSFFLNECKVKELDFFNKFKSTEFELKITQYNIKNVYRINLKANIRFPEIYSQLAVRKAFNTGLVKEEKLYIEYYLISIKIINDIKRLNFQKQYIVEFAETLLKKEKKIKGLLNIINSSSIQDNLNLKVKYKIYKEYSNEIEELIRQGYHFAVILDESFEINYYNIEKLDIFSYILINDSLEEYNQILNYKKIEKKIIKI